MPVRNDLKTNPKPTTTGLKTPTAADAKAAEAAAKAKAEEGAEDLATTTAEKHVPQNDLNAVRGDIRRAFITGEADVVVEQLAKLPAADARALLGEITADPQKLATMMNGDTKVAFLQLMTAKGYVGVEPAKTQPPPTSPKAPQPPPAPPLYRDSDALPAPLRKALLEENVAAAKNYQEAFLAYRDDYRAAVSSSKDMAELRRLGPLQSPLIANALPGVEPGDAKNLEYQHARGDDTVDVSTMTLVADKIRKLSGRAIAGEITFSVDAKVMVTLDGVGAGGDLKLKASQQKSDLTYSPTGQLKVDGVTAKVSADGTATLTVEGDGKKVKYIRSKDAVGAEVLVKGTGGSVTVDDKKGLKVTGSVDGITGRATFNGDSMSFGASKELKIEGGGASIKADVGADVAFQGVTEADADGFVTTTNVGFFDAPPELARGKSWASLSPDVRADYENIGWSEKEWSTAIDLERAKRR